MAATDDFDVEDFIATTGMEQLPLQVEDLTSHGFDPVEFLSVMREKSKEAKVLDDHKKNMVKMGLVCSIKSFNVSEILSSPSTSEKWRDFLINMKRIYGLLDSKADGPTAVTLSRVLFVTSLPVVKYYYQDNGKHIVPTVRPVDVIRGYPFCMCANGFAALIPTSVEATEVLSKAYAYHQCLQSLKSGGSVTKNSMMKYVRFVMRNPLYPESARLATLIDFGILNAEGQLAGKSAGPLKGAAAKFDKLAEM